MAPVSFPFPLVSLFTAHFQSQQVTLFIISYLKTSTADKQRHNSADKVSAGAKTFLSEEVVARTKLRVVMLDLNLNSKMMDYVSVHVLMTSQMCFKDKRY